MGGGAGHGGSGGSGGTMTSLSPGEQAPLGSFGMLKDIVKGSYNSYAYGSYPRAFTRVGSRVFFVADKRTGSSLVSSQLCVTDGTREGTSIVSSKVAPMAWDARGMAEVGGKVIFAGAATDTPNDQVVWVSDGTEAGTQVLVAADPGAAGSPGDPPRYVRAGDKVFFPANTKAAGSELYVTDGTPDGTRMVRDLVPGPNSGVSLSRYARWGLGWKDRLYFYNFDGGGAQVQLYVTDGTDAGTQALTSWTNKNGSLYGDTFDMVVFGDALYFTFFGGSVDFRLWVTDGTPAGTNPFDDGSADNGKGVHGFARTFNIVGDKLTFQAYSTTSNYNSLWAIDGSGAPAVELAQVLAVQDNVSNSNRFANLGARAVFTGYASGKSSSTAVLWITDGTPAGTKQLSTVHPLSDHHFAPLGDQLVFFGDPANASNYEPWITDGTEVGTHLIKELRPGAAGSITAPASALASLGGKVYLAAAVANDDAHLFETDGTADGTRELSPPTATVTTQTVGEKSTSRFDGSPDIWGQLFVNDGTLLFPANFHGDGAELYRLAP
jgi:ELWxxDGT repeat protein